MLVNTSRFGSVEIDDAKVITFPKGLLGFGPCRRFVLLQPNEESPFLWLQALDRADLAFVVAEPAHFVPTYRVALRREQMDEMGLRRVEDAQVLVIVNKHDQCITGNLQGPLVINTITRSGEQLVLSDRRFHTRVPLVELGVELEAIPA